MARTKVNKTKKIENMLGGIRLKMGINYIVNMGDRETQMLALEISGDLEEGSHIEDTFQEMDSYLSDKMSTLIKETKGDK